MKDIIGATVAEMTTLRNGKIAIRLDNDVTLICSFVTMMEGDPTRSRFGRVPKPPRQKSAIVEEADAMRRADEVAHLGDRNTPRRKIIIDDGHPEFGSSEFMPDYVGVDRTPSERGRQEVRVAHSTHDIPDIR